MTIRFFDSYPILNDEIESWEQEWRTTLPEDYKKFLQKYDGATPETNLFNMSDGNNSGVSKFISLKNVKAEAQNLGKDRDALLPVAWAEGGNYVVLKARTEGFAVYF